MSGRDRNQSCPKCGKKMKICVCSPLFPKGWIIATGIVVALVSAWAIAEIIWIPERPSFPSPTSATGPSQSLRERLLNWPLPPAPPINVKVDLPDVPTELPLVRMINGTADQDGLARRLQVLVRYHPEQEIHDELVRLLEQRTVRFADLQPGYGGMAFGVSSGQPQIRVFTPWLTGLSGREGVLQGMLTIYHEFQHFKQWRDDPEDWMYERVPDSHIGTWCTRTYFEVEREAYERHCRLAKQWGVVLPAFSGLCEWVDTPHFPQAVFLWQVRSVPENVSEVCGAHMARAAGHPNFQ